MKTVCRGRPSGWLLGLCLSLAGWLALVAGCGSSGEQLPFAPAGPKAAPDPMQPGPFPIGVKTMTLVDSSRVDETTGKPRTLVTEVWYPALQKYKNGPFYPYDLKAEALQQDLGDKRALIEAEDLPIVPSSTIRDAELDRQHGPYPVIFFSHGANGIRWQSVFYTPQLASHGYVVVAADHEGNTVWDLIRDGYQEGQVATSSYKRLDDMEFLLDTFVAKNRDATDFFFGSMDEGNVAITGHSFGAWTSVTMPCRDPRFKVSLPQAPVISLSIVFGCTLEQYPVPILVMVGTKDDTLSYHDQYCDYRVLQGPRKILGAVENGGHFTFSDLCRLDLAKLANDLQISGAEHALNDGCSLTDNVPWDVAHQAIDFYAVAFFNFYLRGSVGSNAFLVQKTGSPFDTMTITEGQTPDWPEDGGCPK